MKTILVPIDLSATTASVCDAAASLAHSTGSKLILLHVVQPPVITSDYGIAMENIEEIVSVSEKTAATQLAAMQLKYEAPDLSVETVQLTGAPAPLILEEAETCAADYIVMGSHGHTPLYDLLVGTTTHGVLKKARCPVVIVPAEPRKSAKKKTKK
jgi:nucleotide-binding universal stress UspA family protein